MLRIVADTNVIISAYEFGGTPGRVIGKAVSGEIELVYCDAILEETRRVLREKFHWPTHGLEELESLIGSYAVKVYPAEPIDAIQEDPSDNRILECAVAGGADYIVSGDKHLLRLERFRETRIVTAAQFSRMIENPQESER